MSNTISIGCRLPNGLVITHPANPNVKVTLNGLNKTIIKGATYGLTEVPADLWEAWSMMNSTYPALKNGAIFAASNVRDLEAKAKEYKNVETGLEPMRTDGNDKRAKGTKKAEQ